MNRTKSINKLTYTASFFFIFPLLSVCQNDLHIVLRHVGYYSSCIVGTPEMLSCDQYRLRGLIDQLFLRQLSVSVFIFVIDEPLWIQVGPPSSIMEVFCISKICFIFREVTYVIFTKIQVKKVATSDGCMTAPTYTKCEIRPFTLKKQLFPRFLKIIYNQIQQKGVNCVLQHLFVFWFVEHFQWGDFILI